MPRVFKVRIKNNFRRFRGKKKQYDASERSMMHALARRGIKVALYHILAPVENYGSIPGYGTVGLPTYRGEARSSFDSIAEEFGVPNVYLPHPDALRKKPRQATIQSEMEELVGDTTISYSLHAGVPHLIYHEFNSSYVPRQQRQRPWLLFETARHAASEFIQRNAGRAAGENLRRFLVDTQGYSISEMEAYLEGFVGVQ
jgi:hypothetical protein